MSSKAKSPKSVLGTPWKINGLTVKNRFVMGPMAVLQPSPEGSPSAQTKAFLTRRAKGGVGLIIIGGTVATERGLEEAPFKPLMRFDDDRFIPGLKDLVDEVHAFGVPIFAQVFPSFGAMGVPGPNRPTRAASPKPVTMAAPNLPKGMYIPGGRHLPPPAELTIAEIKEIESDVVASVVRARAAGFDGVELGAHMRYVYSSFFSPRSNWREDEYGGSAENRARIVTETVRAIRKVVGEDFPIGVRMGVNEHLEDGQGPEGYAEVASYIANEGIDYIALTDGHYESMQFNLPDYSGAMVEHGEPQAFRKALPKVPLILSSTYDPKQSAEAISEGYADATMLARQMLADPDFPNKILEGREQEVIWCDHNNSCLRRLMLNVPVYCSKNKETGKEAKLAGTADSHRGAVKELSDSLVIAASGSKLLMSIADKAASKKQQKQH